MMLKIDDILAPTLLDALDAAFASEPFEDGGATAGKHAKGVKDNAQMKRTPLLQKLEGEIFRSLMTHPTVVSAIRPKVISPLLFSRYQNGGHYGAHIDNAIMRAGLRADVSFTIFLSTPESYTGGELSIHATFGDQTIKLPRGAVVFYPSSSLHEVKPVIMGTRRVVVGWAQSLVRDPMQREILFDLDQAQKALFEAEGKTPTFDRLTKSTSNLIRMWAEI
jgi:PKHD-type hydroxylase